MAIQTVKAAALGGRERTKINAMFTELYNLPAMGGLTASATELNYNDIVTLGTGAASKSVVLDGSSNYTWPAGGALHYGLLKDLAGTTLTATHAELNVLHDLVNSVSMTSTPATGSCAVQFTLKNAAGAAISHTHAGLFYISDVNGVPVAAVTSYATLVNGTVVSMVTGNIALGVSTAAGLLGVTVTGTSGTRYISFITRSGIITSGAIVIN